MTCVASRSTGQISRSLQDSMGGAGAMSMSIKIGDMTCRTHIRQSPGRIRGRTDQGSAAYSTLMTETAVASMNACHDRTLGRRCAAATRTMTGLAGTCPAHTPVSIAVSGKDRPIRHRVASDIKSFSVGSRDIQGRYDTTVHNPGTKGSGAGSAAAEGLVVTVVGGGQSRAASGISRGRGHDYIGPVPGRS